MSRVRTPVEITPQRLNWLAELVGLELRNVVAKYRLERSHGFPGIRPNPGHRDYSRLSCGVWETQLEPNARMSAGMLAPGVGRSLKAGNCRDFCRSRDDPAAANPAKPLLTLRWTFTAKRACVVVTDSEPDRLAPLPPPAPLGLRGVWVVAARCCAGASERSFSCPKRKRGRTAKA